MGLRQKCFLKTVTDGPTDAIIWSDGHISFFKICQPLFLQVGRQSNSPCEIDSDDDDNLESKEDVPVPLDDEEHKENLSFAMQMMDLKDSKLKSKDSKTSNGRVGD